MRKIKTVMVSYLIAGSLAGACYDAKNPNLPPCGKGTSWPDPCDGITVVVSDAGPDAKKTDASRDAGGDAP